MFSTAVDSNEYVETILSLSVGATWDADAASMLQDELTSIMREYPRESAHQLSLLPSSDLHSIAVFLWDGPHVRQSQLSVIEPLKEFNPSVHAVLKGAFDSRMKDDGGNWD